MGYRIAHIGAFDIENFGDLLFTDVFAAQMRKRLDISEIVCFSPDTCRIAGKDQMTYSVGELERMHRETPFDACVIGGGDLVHFGKVPMYRPWIAEGWQLYNVPSMWIVPALVCAKYGIPLLFNAPGVPAHFTDNENRTVKNVLDGAMYLSVRDENAKTELAAALGRERIAVVPDTVLSISSLIPKETLIPRLEKLYPSLKPGRYVLAQLNAAFSDEDRRAFTLALDRIRAYTGLDILVQPIGYSMGDADIIASLRKEAPDHFLYAEEHMSQYDILAAVSQAAFYIGSSLHGAIVSSSYGVRCIICNVNRYNKSAGFLSLLGKESACIENMNDLYDVFEAQMAEEPADLTAVMQEIDTHFDRIADIIRSGEKPADTFDPMRISEMLFYSSNCEHAQAGVIGERDREIMHLKEENAEIRSAYEATLQSTSWKLTAPLRKLKGRTKE